MCVFWPAVSLPRPRSPPSPPHSPIGNGETRSYILEISGLILWYAMLTNKALWRITECVLPSLSCPYTCTKPSLSSLSIIDVPEDEVSNFRCLLRDICSDEPMSAYNDNGVYGSAVVRTFPSLPSPSPLALYCRPSQPEDDPADKEPYIGFAINVSACEGTHGQKGVNSRTYAKHLRGFSVFSLLSKFKINSLLVFAQSAPGSTSSSVCSSSRQSCTGTKSKQGSSSTLNTSSCR